jgi:hypothetical protein
MLSLNEAKIFRLAELLRSSNVPSPEESATNALAFEADDQTKANSYFAIVAICHQTTPLGERRLEGNINGVRKVGWDYLKEKFFLEVMKKPEWATPNYWRTVRPEELSQVYEDDEFGRTLNRINERTFLINDLGNQLTTYGFDSISSAFAGFNGLIGGDSGFLNFLKAFEAYKDPVMKKSLFFLSIVSAELGWVVSDPKELLSPVDYHELRGHLRIGTVSIDSEALRSKIDGGLVLSENEDVQVRRMVQKANTALSEKTGLSSSAIHYLFWNLFRNCCVRDSRATHCTSCGDNCPLPTQYKALPTYQDRCLFSALCESAKAERKVLEPPYMGHYY